ncbi:class I SAM-dependent methyltransferase [Haloplasma contractile]|uniref:Trans-aconitate 2-methyltransferase protein n=1 Tax=Haloplasma contractile SSD-17B TaxID=1033810 RepID=U2EEP0_9MOLU|nr:class I SAM-dependent methyltransferase [Haloplasma contractile]ERJ13433.1 trans-aconitate 2-methyltransferase protein [Haloplasma contractile SSD-17B]
MELSPRLYHLFVRPKWITNYYNHKIFNNFLKEFDFTNKQVVDLGCGVGTICSYFNPKQYIGLDCDKRRIDYAKTLNPDYTFKTVVDEQVEVPDFSIDYVLIFAVLHHIPKNVISNYLNEFKRILKKSGKLIVIEPCLYDGASIKNTIMKTFDKGEYIRSQDEYMNLLTSQQFKIEQTKRFSKCLYNELFIVAH